MLNRGVSIRIDSSAGSSITVVSLHGNPIAKQHNEVVYVCNGNYKVTKATKDTLTNIIGGSFKGSVYYINGKEFTLSDSWTRIN